MNSLITKPIILITSCGLLGLLAASPACMAAPGDKIALPNAGFEQTRTLAQLSENSEGILNELPAGLPPAEAALLAGLPEGYGAYQWGPAGNRFFTGTEKGAGRGGGVALRAQNMDPLAKAGAFTQTGLKAGSYRLSVWARAAPGQVGHVAIYLGTTYSRHFKITDKWQLVSVKAALPNDLEKAEINIQNSSGNANTVWFDDIALEQIEPTVYSVKTPDPRPKNQRPRTLVFSPINVNYLRENAAQMAARGFRGFLFDQVMVNWDNDIWATDGNAATRGQDDALLREVTAANKACKPVGIDSNFVKVAFNTNLPDWFDDTAWAKVTSNFKESARFARLSGCAGVAIDPEYIAEQYQPTWPGYAKNPRPLPELKAKICERWHTVTSAMLKEFPNMVLLSLQEGTMYYGELYQDIFNGTLQAMAEAKAPGGLHLLAEGTYQITDITAFAYYRDALQGALSDEIPLDLQGYWKSHCSIAFSAWPLGYYHQIQDKDGKPILNENGELQYTGRESTFGNKPVGSYADKSAWYTPQVFAGQMAALNTFSPRYNWIYAHGAVFWQWTPEQEKKYLSGAHKAASNSTGPIVPNLEEYTSVIANPGLVVVTNGRAAKRQ